MSFSKFLNFYPILLSSTVLKPEVLETNKATVSNSLQSKSDKQKTKKEKLPKVKKVKEEEEDGEELEEDYEEEEEVEEEEEGEEEEELEDEEEEEEEEKEEDEEEEDKEEEEEIKTKKKKTKFRKYRNLKVQDKDNEDEDEEDYEEEDEDKEYSDIIKPFYPKKVDKVRKVHPFSDSSSFWDHNSSKKLKEDYQKHLKKYKKFFASKELINSLKNRGVLNIPVNLTILEGYYKELSEYNYNENYFYNDKIFVLDKNSKYALDNQKYKKFKHWLTNLSASKDYLFSGNKKYGNHSLKQHIDWVDGNSDSQSKLANILEFDFYQANVEAFSPKRKKIFLKYDFPHTKRVNLYSNYSLNNRYSPNMNFYKEINYGKLKEHPKTWDNVFYSYELEKYDKKPSCETLRNASMRSIRLYYTTDEGYDGICDGFNLREFNQKNLRFSTPFVSYRIQKPNYWSTEYYFYNLGKYQNDSGYSEDLNSTSSPESLWYIDYSNLFSVDKVESHRYLKPRLKINLNLKKIKNINNFLKISSAFKFILSFSVDGKQREINFDLKDVLSHKTFEIKGMLDKSLFSSFTVKVIKNQEFASDVEFINQGKHFFKYSVDTSALMKKKLIFEKLEFRAPKNKNVFPFEFENLEKSLECFFLVSKKKNNAFNVHPSVLDKLNLRVSVDDKKGTVNIKYFDFLEKIEKEGTIDGLLTFFKISDDRVFESKEAAKISLKEKYKDKLNEKFWDNVDFVSKNYNSFSDVNTFKFKFSFKKEKLNNLWEKFFKNVSINIKNQFNLAPTPLLNGFNNWRISDSEDLGNRLFKFPQFNNSFPITRSDYSVIPISNLRSDQLTVLVKLNSYSHPEYNGHKEYVFTKNYFSENFDRKSYRSRSRNKSNSSDSDTDNSSSISSKNAFFAVLATLGGAGTSLGGIQIFNFFRKRSII